jgi:hypothetical protein
MNHSLEHHTASSGISPSTENTQKTEEAAVLFQDIISNDRR